MSGLGIQDYPAAPPVQKKKNWVKLTLTAFMVIMVVALAGMVISNVMKWLFV